MINEFHAAFLEARDIQLLLNDARRIRTEISRARDNPVDAASRWPFELLQNAYDAGPRPPRGVVSISLGWEPVGQAFRVWFKHDAAAFGPQDIAALLSGGSSKEFDSVITTGRFGTGFLSTHVLSPQVQVEGLLAVGDRVGRFSIALDRAGNEEAIAQNGIAAADALRSVEHVVGDESEASARFVWEVPNLNVYASGVAALEQALPFVFGTCPLLGSVSIAGDGGDQRCWSAEGPKAKAEGDLTWTERDLSTPDGSRHTIIRTPTGSGPHAAALYCSLARRVVPPPDGLARLFRRFPLRGTGALPIRLVLDGQFTVDPERSEVAVNLAGGDVVRDALKAGLAAIGVAHARGDANAHALAFAGPAESNAEPTERKWWNEALATFAKSAAELPLVASRSRILPTVASPGQGPIADFPVPAIADSSSVDEVPLDRVRALMQAATWCDPPTVEVAPDWQPIARGWAALGVDVKHVSLSTLCKQARQGRTTWAELANETGGSEWLLDLVDAVGLAWASRGGTDASLLNGLLPDQTGMLRDPKDVDIDGGIPDVLKEIAIKLDIPIRQQLLDLAFSKATDAKRRPSLAAAIEAAVPRRRTRDQVIEACLKVLEAKIPLQKRLDPMAVSRAKVAGELAAFLWAEVGDAAASMAQRLPLLLASGECERATPGKRMMAPVSTWRERARPFAAAWPPGRILHDDVDAAATAALIALDVVIPDPLVCTRAADLRGARLAPMLRDARSEDQLTGLTVKDETFTSIALLQPEVLNRCQESAENAGALLGFVVVCLAQEDQTWREWRPVKARQAAQDLDLVLRDALWLGDLGSRAWVPGAGEDGGVANVRASRDTLKPLLKPAWLVDNKAGIELLTQCFGFDALDLQLLGMVLAEGQLQEVRDRLARLVEVSQGDLTVLDAALTSVEEKRDYASKITRLRQFGLAVQTTVGATLLSLGLDVTLIDRGFDFMVAVRDQTPLDDLTLAFDVGPYLIEVKSTVRDEVALTPLQARTAGNRPAHFVLCVVKVASMPDESATDDELVALVMSNARFVTDLGPDAAVTVAHVGAAAGAVVGLKNEHELRYVVKQDRWSSGLTLTDWVHLVAMKLREQG